MPPWTRIQEAAELFEKYIAFRSGSGDIASGGTAVALMDSDIDVSKYFKTASLCKL